MGKEEKSNGDLESVYVTYWNRLQHSLFLSFLLLASVATTGFLIISFVSGHVSYFFLPQFFLQQKQEFILLVRLSKQISIISTTMYGIRMKLFKKQAYTSYFWEVH